jgi:hypothetical protein
MSRPLPPLNALRAFEAIAVISASRALLTSFTIQMKESKPSPVDGPALSEEVYALALARIDAGQA